MRGIEPLTGSAIKPPALPLSYKVILYTVSGDARKPSSPELVGYVLADNSAGCLSSKPVDIDRVALP